MGKVAFCKTATRPNSKHISKGAKSCTSTVSDENAILLSCYSLKFMCVCVHVPAHVAKESSWSTCFHLNLVEVIFCENALRLSFYIS